MAQTRIPFHNQRLIFVLIHYTRVDPDHLETLQQALQEVLTVAAGAAGAERIPNFGLGLLRRPYEQLIPLSSPKTCFSQFLAKLSLLPNIEPLDASGLYDGGLDAMLDEALPAAVKAAVVLPYTRHRRLKVVLVTWEAAGSVMTRLAAALHSGRALHVSSAQVVQVWPSDAWTEGRLPLDPVEAPAGVQVIGRHVSGGLQVFTALFKEWLMEEAGELPHLTLFLDPHHQLLLGVSETSVNPALLSAALQSRLSVPLTAGRLTLTGANGGGSVSCCRASASARLRLCSMSPAWCCGPLLHVLPSASASLSYEQYEHNEQTFAALQTSLHSRDEALLCTLHTTPHSGVPLTPRLLLYPAPHGVLALSHLVPGELRLPHSVLPPPPLPVQQQVREAMEAVLESLPVPSDDEAISYFNTGITTALRAQMAGNKRSVGGTSASQGKRVACGRVLPRQQEQRQPQQTSTPDQHQHKIAQQLNIFSSKPFVHPCQAASSTRMSPVVKVGVTKGHEFGTLPSSSGTQKHNLSEQRPVASSLQAGRDTYPYKQRGLWREEASKVSPALHQKQWQPKQVTLPLVSRSSTPRASQELVSDPPKNVFRFTRRDV